MRADLVDSLAARFSPLGIGASVSLGMPVLQIAPGQLTEVVRALRDELGFDMLLDVTAVDWLGHPGAQRPRFDVVWHFFATSDCQRLRIKTQVPEDAPQVDSLVPWYGSAAFMERECHDMLGIAFRGNADLRPILLYEGFVGHPLRKDYDKHHEQPLVAYRDAGAPR
jgi:NADH-quinone oxidoreductase subunit C